MIAEGTAEVVSATRLPATSAKANETRNVVRLTMPPSTNNLFLSRGKKRIKTPEYRAWIDENIAAATKLKPPTKYPVRVCWTLCGKVNEQRDGANTEKASVDLLVALKVLAGDSLKYVCGETWDYKPSEDEQHIMIWWEEIQ